MPQEPGVPVQEGAVVALPPTLAAAKVENFLANFSAPQCGHFVPCQLLERTRISLSFLHFPQ